MCTFKEKRGQKNSVAEHFVSIELHVLVTSNPPLPARLQSLLLEKHELQELEMTQNGAMGYGVSSSRNEFLDLAYSSYFS